MREPEHDICERRSAETDEQRRPPAIAIGDIPPDGGRHELRHRKGRSEESDDRRGSTEVIRVQGQERPDDHHAHHVDERDRHEHGKTFHRRAPTPSTIALATIKTTPNAAATPVSASRRLDRISIDTGRVSYV